MIITTAPAARAPAAPPGPKRTSSTWSGVATMIATSSASRTAPVMLSAACTPSAASAAARPGTMS